MEAEIHTHSWKTPWSAGSLIKNTLPKPPFITQARAFNPSGMDLSEDLNNRPYTHTNTHTR